MINTWELMARLLPIWKFIKKYNGADALCDLVAGITVGLTLIPQVIAYASLAGLEPQYGLYSALCGGIVYAIFGTIPELNIAPTALLSLLTYQYTHKVTFGNVKAAIMLTFFAGILELLCGILHLGFLIDFVSTPVVSAFTSAGAITIASSQIKNLFGLKYNAENFIQVWKNFFMHISEVQLWDTALGFGCIIVLLAMRTLKDYGEPPVSTEKTPEKSSTYKKIIWFISVGRNAMVVVGCAFMAYIFKIYDHKPFALTSKVPSGFPSFSVPLKPIEASNGTSGTDISQMLAELGYSIAVIPFIAIIANVGIAKAFAHGKVVDASQEMVAVGLCNIAGSFFGSYPVNASFSRAAVSSASGVRTPLSGIYTGIMVMLAFTFLTPYFPYIPKATLAAVIICAVVFMVEVAITKMIWRINRLDMIPFIITFICCLLMGIEVGILIGILVEVCKLMYFTSRPKIMVKKIHGRRTYVRVTLNSLVFFSSAEYCREKIFQCVLDSGQMFSLVLVDCTQTTDMDFTAGKCFESLIKDLKKIDKSLIFLASNEHISKMLQASCGKDVVICKSEEEFDVSCPGKINAVSNGDMETVTTQM
ncbi:sodium-independent sulfate anion transporter-like [Anthonomus grandis grandis]|uniref:sodium-independent sulfate anion transporter-like n=1 Tax=Anthonomus grandis grandis TaxID=2921223 RepID=UPI0021667314|nr:sodium-independent sulfate anion transporter-like [Anthonomus grandis grandis]XP_050298010.1 sodium-independent sulfate anion transporter-like [Anthonomus grandis grandis]XP_050298011.1 sodium-independent sulfate anion transporter-like [Anthonomus grandis grandis]